MAKRGVRDQMVIATKYTTPWRTGFGDREIIVNTGGNGTKSLRGSLAASLKNLQTDYVDLLYIHWWDFTCSIEELMQSLNDMITSGKVLYLRVSDTPAWIVAKANQYARDHGLRQFSVYQGRWFAGSRNFEREIIPVALAEGMALAPWGSLGGGAFKTAAQRGANTGRQLAEPDENVLKISAALDVIANRKSTTITSIALAYVIHKTPYVFPIVGGRSIQHIKGNIEALTVELSRKDIEEIESAVPFDLGFPGNVFGTSAETCWLGGVGGWCDYVARLQPISPHKV